MTGLAYSGDIISQLIKINIFTEVGLVEAIKGLP